MSVLRTVATACLSIVWITISAQATETTALTDTTIYEFAETPPRFPGCEQLDTTEVIKHECAQAALLSFVYNNVQYPIEARRHGNAGTVVVRFVVETDGSVSQAEILRDVEGGCGEEVLRIINAMNDVGAIWKPGEQAGQIVRTYVTLPVRFRLQEAPPYILSGRDTIYTRTDTPLSFEGGDGALDDYIADRLVYPEMGNDSCVIGYVDTQILVQPDGKVRVLNVNDYNALGTDYQYAAINTATSTIGRWTPATYQGRSVPTSLELRFSFVPTDAQGCATEIANFTAANTLLTESMQAYDNDELEVALEKITKAIERTPDNADLLSMRGQMYLDQNRMAEACADLSRVRDLLMVSWYDGLLPVICR